MKMICSCEPLKAFILVVRRVARPVWGGKGRGWGPYLPRSILSQTDPEYSAPCTDHSKNHRV